MSATSRASSVEKLHITLWRDADGSLRARSIEAVDHTSRVRFSFGHNSSLDRVFKPRVRRELEGLVASSGNRRGMTILPDLRIGLGEMILEGCRIIVAAAHDGAESIVIHFMRYFGRVRSLFSESFAHRDCLSETAVDQAVAALEAVYMPLRNFSAYIDTVLADSRLDADKAKFLRSIRDRIAAMDHVSDVISHYVAAQSTLAEPGRGAEPQRYGRLPVVPDPLPIAKECAAI